MRKIILLILITCWCACKNNGIEPTPSGPPYFSQVKGIIANNCLSCHSSTGSWAGRPTKFDSDADIVAAASAIKTAVAGPWTLTIKKMPQGGSLSQADINTIVAWVSAGGQATN